MDTSTRIAAGVGLALAGLLLVWSLTRPASGPSPAPAAGSTAAEGGARAEETRSRAPGDGDEGSRTAPGGAPEPAAAGAPAPDPLGVLVYGSILDREGERVEKGRLAFECEDGTTRSGSIGAPGSYSALGLAAGTWRLSISCPGHYPLDEELAIPAGVERHRHDVTLERAVVLCVRFVTPDGRDYEEVLAQDPLGHGVRPVAVATREAPPARLAGVTGLDASNHGVGRYRDRLFARAADEIPPGCAGLLELTAPPPLFVSAVLRDVVLATQGVFPGEEAIELVLEQGAVRGALGGLRLTVVDATSGAPLSEGNVHLSTAQGGGFARPLGPDGTIEFADQMPGLLELDPWVPGYEKVKKRVRLVPGETVDFELALLPAVRIGGRVLGPDGAGVSARMNVVPLHQVAMPLDVETRHWYASDTEGRFQIEAGRAEVMLVVNDPAWAVVPRRVDARGGAVEGVEIRVAPGAPVVLRSAGPDSGAARVVLTDTGGAPFWTRRLYASTELRLLPGSYGLELSRDELVYHRRTVEVGAQGITLELPAGP